MIFLSTEFWIVFQICVLLFLFLIIWYFLKNSRPVAVDNSKITSESADQIVKLLEPLLKEAESSAMVFESQILEKKQLIKQLNEKLDSRIISLNLLLNRADACLMNNANLKTDIDVAGIQEAILSLYKEGYTTGAISKELSLSEKEIDLVIGLKKKFLAMEKNTEMAKLQ